MARRSKKGKKSYKGRSRPQRDTFDISRRRRLRPFLRKERRYKLNEAIDRRHWIPDDTITKTVYGTAVELDEEPARKRADDRYSKISFVNPRAVVVCERRKRRRETLFAFKRIGKGKGVSRRRRRTIDSDVRC